jgi:hypothetical protein
MKFLVTIDCDNDAFQDDPVIELQSCLDKVKDSLEYGVFDGCEFVVYDSNGNVVGKATVTA